MKILMIGLGSIGQRHVRNIRTVLGDGAELIAYRKRGLKTTFTDKLEIREGVDLEKEYDITSYNDLDEALSQKPDIAFITNITSKHMECAIKAAKAGCDLFIEKPLSHSAEGVKKLKDIVKKNDLKVFMGFQNRYHPCVKAMKKTLTEGIIGDIKYASCEFSERLTTMHRYEDYKDTYMANVNMGGGPVLNLLMHDLDILNYLFGKAHKVSCLMHNVSDLNIDVEESADAIINYFDGNEKNRFNVSVHTDFLQYPPSHKYKIVGSKGRIEADLNKAEYVIYVGDDIYEEKSFDDFARNDMFINELKDFISGENMIGLDAGIDALNLALAMKASDMDKNVVYI